MKKKNEGLALIFSVLAISVIGCLFVYSASNYVAEVDYKDKFYFFNKQLTGVVIGAVCMFACYKLDYKKLLSIAYPSYFVGIVLLALVFLPLFGVEVYGAKRWIKLGFITIQPSEIAKFCYVLAVAKYFYKHPNSVNTLWGIMPVILGGVVVCGLIIAEPNMSITMCVAFLMLAFLFVSGVSLKRILLFLAPVVALVPLLIFLEPYRLKRLMAFIDPWQNPKGEGYQLLQSLYALGSGGWFGVGLFNSRQKFKFLPFAESDFILSVIGEEVGFLGIIMLFLLFGFVIWQVYNVAKNCKNLFSYYFCCGVLIIFFIQVTINALVVSGSIPPTGLPLPLVSAGNTSIIVYMASFGVVGNIANDRVLTK